MPKQKLKRFAEVQTFSNVFYLPFEQTKTGLPLKGKWKNDHFKNENPLVLELGCGKGDYTVGLAEKNPEKNFIGIDIKGNRIWKGAKRALDEKLSNVAFLRTRIDFIESAFDSNEVNEIWITFPDPQPNKERKRLTSEMFLNRYKNILVPGSVVHLKTDNLALHEYTIELLEENKYNILACTTHLYNDTALQADEARAIKTFYESKYLKQGKKINYVKFVL